MLNTLAFHHLRIYVSKLRMVVSWKGRGLTCLKLGRMKRKGMTIDSQFEYIFSNAGTCRDALTQYRQLNHFLKLQAIRTPEDQRLQ
jgi:hypothetical protein